MIDVSNIFNTILLQLVTNQTRGYFAKILGSTMATIQTTTPYQKFGHALALPML
jgi:hypothetical protein